MILQSVVLIIFICSLVGVLIIIWRKIPILNSLSQNGSAGIRKHSVVINLENKIKNVLVFFEKQIFLHKFLSKVKVVIIKIEIRIDALLHNIRRKAQAADKKVEESKIDLPPR